MSALEPDSYAKAMSDEGRHRDFDKALEKAGYYFFTGLGDPTTNPQMKVFGHSEGHLLVQVSNDELVLSTFFVEEPSTPAFFTTIFVTFAAQVATIGQTTTLRSIEALLLSWAEHSSF